MNAFSEIEQAEILAKANAAFRLAAQDVIERAKRYKTSIVVWKDGAVCEIPFEQLDSIRLDLVTDSIEIRRN